jgi:DNA polymerase I-like protein with 3'-5' exonuclease and polymerase domains
MYAHDMLPSLLVHDSIVLEAYDSETEEYGKALTKTMESMGNQYFPLTPWQADLDVVQSWATIPEIF